jgi:hypothetical protein
MILRFRSKHRDGGFLSRMIASFPEGLAPPPELLKFFRWQEENGLDEINQGESFGRLDPAQPDFCMFTSPVDPGHIQSWCCCEDVVLGERVAPFVRTGGDGSYAALWRDDGGKLIFVHMGSGSGSTMAGVLTESPIDLLRLLAIGYDELCWPAHHAKTPQQVHEEQQSDTDSDKPYVPRTALKHWVEQTFGVTVPCRASEIVSITADMDDVNTRDPFLLWVKAIEDKAG